MSGSLCVFRRCAFDKFDSVSGADDSGTALRVVQNRYRAIFVPEDGDLDPAVSKKYKKEAPAAESKPKLSDKGRSAMHKGVCARLGKQNCGKNRMGPNKGKTGIMIPNETLRDAGIKTDERYGTAYLDLEDFSDDDIAKLAKKLKAKIRNKEALGHMSSMGQ